MFITGALGTAFVGYLGDRARLSVFGLWKYTLVRTFAFRLPLPFRTFFAASLAFEALVWTPMMLEFGGCVEGERDNHLFSVAFS